MNIGSTEFLVIFALALIVLGPRRIPEVARYLGRAMKQFREAAAEVKRNLHLDEMDDVHREMRNTWRSSRQTTRIEDSFREPDPPRTSPEPKDPEEKTAQEEKVPPPSSPADEGPSRED